MGSHNYAPDPKKEQAYTQLQNFTLSNVTAKDIDRVTQDTFIQATNQDALLTFNTINKAAMRDGSPMPDKGNMVMVQQTVNDVPIVIRPPKGEVWRLNAISVTNLAALSASQSYYVFISNDETDDGSVPQTSTDLFFSSLSSTATALTTEAFFDDNAFLPLDITNKMFLRVYGNFAGTTTGHIINWFYAYSQLR